MAQKINFDERAEHFSLAEFADILALWRQVRAAVSRDVRFTSGLVSVCDPLFLDVKLEPLFENVTVVLDSLP